MSATRPLHARAAVTAVAVLGVALGTAGPAAAAPAAADASGKCSPKSPLCLPIDVPVNLDPVTLESPLGPLAPISVDLGPADLSLTGLADLAQLSDVESGFDAVNALDASLSGQLSGLNLDGFGMEVYGVDDFRVSAGATYDQLATGLHGNDRPGAYLLDNLRLSSQVVSTKLAGLDAFGTHTYAVDSLRLSAAGSNSSILDLLGTSPTSASLVDLFRVSAQTGVDRVAGTDAIGDTYLIDSLRLSALATNATFGSIGGHDLVTLEGFTRLSDQVAADNLAGTDALGLDTYVLDRLRLSSQADNNVLTSIAEQPVVTSDITTRLSGQMLAENVAGITNDDAGAYLLDQVGLDAGARDALIADLAEGPELSSTVVDNLDAHAAGDTEGTAGNLRDTVKSDVLAPVNLVTRVKSIVGLVLGGF